eukprot:757665-Hanusia_phi.AAC.2
MKWSLPDKPISQSGCGKDGPFAYAKELSRRLPNPNRRLSSSELNPILANNSSPFSVEVNPCRGNNKSDAPAVFPAV